MSPRSRSTKPKALPTKKREKQVLARWRDGLWYVIKILKVSDRKKSCLVEFEDQSTAFVLFKDLLDEHKEDEEACHNCGGEEELENNGFIKCTNCDRSYHRHCHVPPIIADSMAKQFVCRICVFAACAKAGGAVDTGPMAARLTFMKREFPYDLEHLKWNPSHTSNTAEMYCYCGGHGNFYNKMLQCCRCHQWFHEACVRRMDRELLMGDRFYLFACAHCNFGEEFILRKQLTWDDILHVVMFHQTLSNGIKFVNLDTEILPLIIKHASSFGLSNLLENSAITEQDVRPNVVFRLFSQAELYGFGSEMKKKNSTYFLRQRIPPPSPCFFIPESDVKITNLTVGNPKILFQPPKFTNPVPHLVHGLNRFIPATMNVKLQEAKRTRLKSEHNYSLGSNDYSPSNDSTMSKENYDTNNNTGNTSYRKPLCPSKLESLKTESVDKESVTSDESGEYLLPDPVQRICPITFSQGMKGEDKEIEKFLNDKDSAYQSENESKEFWSLDTAFPEPPNFRGVNNPFLTDVEVQDLREQQKFFLRQLDHLAQTVGSYPSTESVKTDSSLNPPSPCSAKSEKTLAVSPKGFKGELTNLLNTNASSTGDKSQKISPRLRSPKLSPEKLFCNTYSPPRSRRSLSSSQGSKTSPDKSSDTSPAENHRDSFTSPSRVVNGIKLSSDVASKMLNRNGFRKSLRSNSGEIHAQKKRLNAVSRCLKKLTPTCGFHFPKLDENHPSVTNDNNPDKSEKDSSDRKPHRGLKRRHSTQQKLANNRKEIDGSDTEEENNATEGKADVGTVRRSHRSRQTVKRFETTDMRSRRSETVNMDVEVNSSILSMAKYNVVSLRVRPDSTVDYLIDWFET